VSNFVLPGGAAWNYHFKENKKVFSQVISIWLLPSIWHVLLLANGNNGNLEPPLDSYHCNG